MPDDAICKRLLNHRAEEYRNDPVKGARNESLSPIFEMLNVSKEFGIFDICLGMAENECHFSKTEWKNKIWDIAWSMEDNDYELHNNRSLLFRIIERPFYLIWWIIADLLPNLSGNCASLLKDHDYRLKRKSFSHKVCNLCYLGIREDVNHIVMQCLFFEGTRKEMLDVINAINDERIAPILANPQHTYDILMGKHPEGAPFETMLKIWGVW